MVKKLNSSKMTSTWRKFGLTYIEYSNIAAAILRNSLKPAQKREAQVRDYFSVTFTIWQDGRPVVEKKK